MEATAVTDRTDCQHCGRRLAPALAWRSNFCCRGCETVHGLLRERGLEEYYRLRAIDGGPASPVASPGESFEFLDDPEFFDQYGWTGADGSRAMRFHVESAHCAACVWLTEKIPGFVPGVRSARMDLGSSVLTVGLGPEGKFAAVANELSHLGYPPQAVRCQDIDPLKEKADRRLLAQTGVAGACAGNIMLLAVSLYSGADGRLATAFRWTSFGLCLPVLLYSALPFYQSAWRSIRARGLSIDIPIALGIAIGALSSAFNLATGSPFIYFDSLSTLVFLMLASRYLLRKTQQKAIHSSRLARFLMPSRARRLDPERGAFHEARIESVLPGDLVEVRAGECVPVDGIVVAGSSSLDQSLMSGEFSLKPVGPGDLVQAGNVNESAPLRVRASSGGTRTRLAGILRMAEQDASRKAPIVSFADRVSKLFVAGVLVSVAAVFVFGLRSGLHEATNLALALSIVTCPCAFALATPLAMSISIGRCAGGGSLIKGSDALERLARIEEVVLDKTGTLTAGKFEVLSYSGEVDWADVVAMEKRSAHPIARAIVNFFEPRLTGAIPEVRAFAERPGVGIAANVGGFLYELGGRRSERLPGLVVPGITRITVHRQGVLVGSISLGDRLREDSLRAVHALRGLGLGVSILSGDSPEAVSGVAGQLSIAPANWEASMSPEAKRQWILRHSRALMVGDGANDAGALAAAFVGVAVHGGMEVSMKAADIYQRTPGILPVARLIVVARETLKVVHRCFAFSLLYNLAGITGVLLGRVAPLFAAVLMPLSALTVFGISIVGTARLRRALRGELP